MYHLDTMPDDPEAEWNRLMETAGKISDSFDRLFESYDLILTPTVPVVAKDAADRAIDNDVSSQLAAGRRDVRFMAFANTTGHPAITVPAGFNPEGLPVGAQFIAAKGAEDTLFSIAYELEDDIKWSRYWAPISVAFAGS